MAAGFPNAIASCPARWTDAFSPFVFRLACSRTTCYGLFRFGGHPALSPAALLSPDDSLLMQAIARRDKSAFEQFYKRHSSVLFALALRIVGDRSDAEDVF